jgi:hypothetical protein
MLAIEQKAALINIAISYDGFDNRNTTDSFELKIAMAVPPGKHRTLLW